MKLRHDNLILRSISLFFVFSLLLTACSQIGKLKNANQPVASLPAGSDGYPWWNDTVFYEIFVRSFFDSNGDGVGDINGIIEKLDYLNDGNPNTNTDLGITGLWLMPINPAVAYHGYDVTDYFTINPQYGTLEDFKRLLDEAHQRGVRVIIDLPLNHTSNRHPWFIDSLSPSSQYRDWYVWSESEPTGSGWHKADSGFYYGNFGADMPDLNYTNPDVTKQMQEVVQYWLEDVGVDGFRLDAAKYLIEEGIVQTNTASTHTWYENFRPYYKALNAAAVTIGEIWDNSVAVSQYIEGDELDLAFDFDLAQAMVTSARVGRADEVIRISNRDTKLFHSGQFATFLTNHDQARLMQAMADQTPKAKAAATMLLTLPGVPFIYYGEEIGMLGKKPDELIRTPMQWSSAANAGFTSGNPWQPVNPDYPDKNEANQDKDPNSLLSHYRNLLQLRTQHAALRVGEFYPLQADQDSLFSFLRVSKDEKVLVLINLGSQPLEAYNLSLTQGPLAGEYQPVILYSSEPDPVPEMAVINANAQGGLDPFQPLPELPAFSSYIIQLKSKQ
jgi:alpha-amylase